MGFFRQEESESVSELLSGSWNESMAAHRTVGARIVQKRRFSGLAGEEGKEGRADPADR